MESTSTPTTSFPPTFPRQHLTGSGRSQGPQSRFKREAWIFYIAAESRVWLRWKRAQARLISEPGPKSTFPSGPRRGAQTRNLMCSHSSNEPDFWVPVLSLPSPGPVFSCRLKRFCLSAQRASRTVVVTCVKCPLFGSVIEEHCTLDSHAWALGSYTHRLLCSRVHVEDGILCTCLKIKSLNVFQTSLGKCFSCCVAFQCLVLLPPSL